MYTNRARITPFTLLVQQRLLHPLRKVHQPSKRYTVYFVGAAETAAPHDGCAYCLVGALVVSHRFHTLS